eukprot:4117551-Pyramimonas_sp.AAC.1
MVELAEAKRVFNGAKAEDGEAADQAGLTHASIQKPGEDDELSTLAQKEAEFPKARNVISEKTEAVQKAKRAPEGTQKIRATAQAAGKRRGEAGAQPAGGAPAADQERDEVAASEAPRTCGPRDLPGQPVQPLRARPNPELPQSSRRRRPERRLRPPRGGQQQRDHRRPHLNICLENERPNRMHL